MIKEESSCQNKHRLVQYGKFFSGGNARGEIERLDKLIGIESSRETHW